MYIKINYKIYLLILVSISSLKAQQEKRLALVIGNANYNTTELNNPVNDAKLIASTLDSLNFDVILKTNIESQGQFKNAILEFGNKRPDYDAAIVYYAGHGMQLDGENYLLPTKENFESKDHVFMSGVSVQKIMHFLRDSNKVNILILDACRDNPYEKSFNSKSRSIEKSSGLAKIPAPTGSLIAFSTDAGNVADDGEGENSFYSRSLSKNMFLVDTSIDQVFRNVRAEVLEWSEGGQRPVEETQLTGDVFYLNKSDFTDELEEIDLIISNNEKEKYQNSILTIEKILNRYPDNSKAQDLKGKLLTLLKSYGDVIKYYNSLIELNGQKDDYFTTLGYVFYELGEKSKALENHNKAIDIDPNNSINFYKRAKFFQEEKEYEKALTDISKSIEIDPDDMGNLHQRAVLYQNNLDDYEKALGDYLKIIQLDSDLEFAKSEYLYNNIAQIYRYEIKDYQKALEYYTKEIELSPESGVGYRNRAGLYYYNLNDKEKALEDFNKSIELEPESEDHYYYRAKFFQEEKEYEKALTDISKSIEIDPDDMDNINQKANLLVELNRYKEGINLFEFIIEKYSKLISQNKIKHDEGILEIIYAYQHITDVYLKHFNDYKNSLLYVEKAIKSYTTLKGKYLEVQSYVLGLRGDIYLNDGEFDKAKEDYLEAIEIYPEYRNAYYNLVNYYLTVKDYDEAIKTIDKTIEMDHNDPDGYYKESLIYYHQKDYLNSLIYVSNAILKSEEEDRLANGEYFISDLNNIDKITLEDLYAFRAELFSILGNNKSACNDYKVAVESEEYKENIEVSEFIKANCN
jgi:tetratricopeptide (TPR) repeat protein